MKKRTKIIVTIIVCIITILMCAIIPIIKEPKEPQMHNDLEVVKKHLIQLLEKDFINENMTIDQLEKIIGGDVFPEDIILGPDSFIMAKPSQKLIKKYDLAEYVEKQEKFAQKIQEEYLKEYEYELTESEVLHDGIVQHIDFVSMYYGMYEADFNELLDWIVERKSINLMAENISEQQEIELYKYKILIMETLDNNFEVYKNVLKEKKSTEIVYQNDKPADSDELLTLLANMIGQTYRNAYNVDESRLESYKQQLIAKL